MIPPEADSEFAAGMEEVLDSYALPEFLKSPEVRMVACLCAWLGYVEHAHNNLSDKGDIDI